MFVTNNYTPYSGGVVRSIDTTVRALQNLGHEVRVVTLDFLGSAHNDPAYVERIPSLVRWTYKGKHMAIPLYAYYHMYRSIKKYAPDIIHVHHPFLLGTVAGRVGRYCKIPVVFTYHTLYELYAHYVPLPQILTQKVIRFLVKRFCFLVDGIIAPSRAVQQQVCFIKAVPTIVLPSALDDQFLSIKTFKKKVGLGLPHKLLYVGRFEKEKNVPFLLDLVARLDAHGSFELTLVGYGSEYEALQKYAYETLKLGNRVQFVLKPDKKRLMKEYKHADIFLFASQSDTQGLVLAEAMASGLPVIALDGPGQRDIVVPGENGFLVHDSQQMLDAIVRLAGDNAMYTAMQKKARATGARYNPLILAKQLLHFYLRLSVA